MAKEKETIPSSLITLTVGLLVAIISVWYGQNNGLLPEQISKQAPLVDNFFNIMITIATALFFLVEGAIVFALIKFRHRKGDDTDSPHITGNFSLEVFWTAIPAFLVIGLGVYSVQLYSEMGGFNNMNMAVAHHHHHNNHNPVQIASLPGKTLSPLLLAEGDEIIRTYGLGANPNQSNTPPDLEVNVTGLQYAWIFNYPDSGVTAGELHIPVEQDVQLNIEAQDVIHSFWLPEFRLKQDALPGETATLRFTATKTGTYPVVCAELCGAYHGSMRSSIVVQTQEEYDQWVEENQVAQTEANTVAHRPRETRLIDNYVENLGIDADTLSQLH